MRCVVTLKDGGAMDRAMRALANHRYRASGESVAPEGHPREWKSWLLEITSAELASICDEIDAEDIVAVKPVGDLIKSGLH